MTRSKSVPVNKTRNRQCAGACGVFLGQMASLFATQCVRRSTERAKPGCSGIRGGGLPEKFVEVERNGLDDLNKGLHRVLAVKAFEQRVGWIEFLIVTPTAPPVILRAGKVSTADAGNLSSAGEELETFWQLLLVCVQTGGLAYIPGNNRRIWVANNIS